jgi:hypothetical protein
MKLLIMYFLHPSVTSCIAGPNILLCSQTYSIHVFPSRCDLVSHAHRITCKIAVSLRFSLYVSKLE